MSKKRLIGPNRSVIFPAIAVMVLSSMLWDVVEAYLAGGEEAPTVWMLVLAVVLLGGGTVFAVYQTFNTWKALQEEDRQKAEEARLKAEAEQAAALPEAEES